MPLSIKHITMLTISAWDKLFLSLQILCLKVSYDNFFQLFSYLHQHHQHNIIISYIFFAKNILISFDQILFLILNM